MFPHLCNLFLKFCLRQANFGVYNNINNGTALVVVETQKFHVNSGCQNFRTLTLSYNPAFRTRRYTEEG